MNAVWVLCNVYAIPRFGRLNEKLSSTRCIICSQNIFILDLIQQILKDKVILFVSTLLSIYILGFLGGSVLSCFSCVQLFATLWTVAHQAPLSKRFSRQEYWSGLPCPPSGNLPNQGIETSSLYISYIGKQVLYH